MATLVTTQLCTGDIQGDKRRDTIQHFSDSDDNDADDKGNEQLDTTIL